MDAYTQNKLRPKACARAPPDPAARAARPELLVNANNSSVAYVNAILAGTPQTRLVECAKPKKVKDITP